MSRDEIDQKSDEEFLDLAAQALYLKEYQMETIRNAILEALSKIE